MVRTERESDRRRREEKWRTCWCCRDQQRACRMEACRPQRKNLSKLGLPKKKRFASVQHRESSWQVRRSRLCQKEKEQSHQSRLPDHKGERVKVSERCTVAREREGSEREHGVERVDSTVKEGGFQGGQGGQAKEPP